MSATHVRISSPFDECNYQIVKEIPGQSETILGFDDSIEADALCMRMNAFLCANNISDEDIYYTLEMGPNVPEPE